MAKKATSKAGNNMSIAMEPEIQQRMKEVAAKKNVSVSKWIRDLVDKNLPTSDEEVDTVILKIPHKVKCSEEELRSWLNTRVESLVKALVVK